MLMYQRRINPSFATLVQVSPHQSRFRAISLGYAPLVQKWDEFCGGTPVCIFSRAAFNAIQRGPVSNTSAANNSIAPPQRELHFCNFGGSVVMVAVYSSSPEKLRAAQQEQTTLSLFRSHLKTHHARRKLLFPDCSPSRTAH